MLSSLGYNGGVTYRGRDDRANLFRTSNMQAKLVWLGVKRVSDSFRALVIKQISTS